MSTFTDGWNGPGCGGSTLPQVKTLEELIVRIVSLETLINSVKSALSTHEGKSVPSDTTLHGIMAELNNRIGTINTAIAAEQTARTAADNGLTGRINGVINADGSVNTSGTVAADATAKAASALASAKTYTDTKVGNLGAHSNVAAYIVAVQTAINNTITALKTLVKTDEIIANTPDGRLTISSLIEALKGIRGEIYPNHIIDYRNFAYVQCCNAAISGIDSLADFVPRNSIAIIGALSTEYDQYNGDPDDTASLIANDNYGYQHKAGRVYLKYVDTKPWNAIIDMVFTKKVYGEQNEYYNGAIGGSVAKTADRDYLGFGLYHASDVHNKERIYLGIKSEDIVAMSSGQAYVQWAGFKAYVAGVNFIPINADIAPKSAVTEIETVPFVTNRGGTVFNKLTVQTMFTDNYRDLAGHGVALTDAEAGILRIGAPDDEHDPDFPGNENETHSLELYSKTRPDVFIGDGGAASMANYHMAFLEDLAQSIYFQRDVIIAVDYVARPIGSSGSDLTDLLVWVKDGVVVPLNTPDATQVPGFYTMDPTGHTTSGHIFVANDTILIKASTQTAQAPDGFLNDVLPAIGNDQEYALDAVTGIADIIVGATVVDKNGVYGRVTQVGSTEVDITTVATVFEYTLPAYVKFNGTGYDAVVPIPLPRATPGDYLHDISYEWAGAVGPFDRGTPDSEYYLPGYEIWTPHHENPVWDPEQIGDPNAAWSRIHFDLDGYRSAARQDLIDTSLQALATIQSDYGEMEQVAQWQLPESDMLTIANPAYIHNRPWTGIAILDSGAFGSVPDMSASWLVDGGDFTDFNTTIPGYVTPPVAGSNQFRNVIVRLWHGLHADMPEIISPVDATWKNFERTLRFTDDVDNQALYYSDGAKLYMFIPSERVYTDSYTATSRFWHEHDGGGYQYIADGNTIAAAANYGTSDNIWYEIYAINTTSHVGARFIMSLETAYLTKGASSSAFAPEDEIVTKGELLAVIPEPPQTDGKYKLTVTMASGVPAYAWEDDV